MGCTAAQSHGPQGKVGVEKDTRVPKTIILNSGLGMLPLDEQLSSERIGLKTIDFVLGQHCFVITFHPL